MIREVPNHYRLSILCSLTVGVSGKVNRSAANIAVSGFVACRTLLLVGFGQFLPFPLTALQNVFVA